MNSTSREELGDQLEQLAIQAQKHPPTTQERQKALSKLVGCLWGSGKLYRPPQSRLPMNFYGAYEEIYAEARQELFLHICQRIEEYDPERGAVLTWVNLLMDRRFFNHAIAKFRNIRDKRVGKIQLTLDDLDCFEVENLANPEPDDVPLSEKLRDLIEADPEGKFQQAAIEKYPNVTFQLLMLKRLSSQSWSEISQETEIGIPTLSSFYQRNLKKFAPIIQQYLSQQ
ncbi:sigma-70 family RNA polymerase sigma factor [Oscillatoria laete-virens NRMC-F 0139]|nr:sigma-70 family RNA polymerase sigma factor [Oscillatoria laete-virens]MDL5052072.1 sigma-70 family RNA polymerase sigma factor [Oscillatoria laete-virens NRMC-F 0139]